MILAYISCQFKRQSYYYFDTIMTVVGALLAAGIQYFVWTSTQKTGNISLAASEMISSYAILATAYTILMPAAEIAKTIAYQVKKGTIIYDFVRPLDYWKNIFFTQLGKSLYLTLFTIFPLILIYIFVFKINFMVAKDFGAVFLTLLVLLLGYLLSFVMGFLLGILSFVTFRNGGMLSLYTGLAMIFGGGCCRSRSIPTGWRRWPRSPPFMRCRGYRY